MLKRITAVFLLLCFMAGTASASTALERLRQTLNPRIPSFDTYMGKYASAGRTETKSYLIYRKYSGKPSNIVAVAEQYVALLQEDFLFTLIDEQWADFGTYARVTYSLEMSSNSSLSTFSIFNSDDEPAWETPSANIVVQYTIPDSGYAYVHLYYSPELIVIDHTTAYAPPGKTTTNRKTATPTPDTESSASY
ncbi:MAG: hypothetical protein IJA83_08950 [Clostridia bacterium]|nr:hypothetical protein [Clostridia bacterium]